MTSFSDDFNRPDGAPGANWVQVSGVWSIISQQLSPGTTGTTVLLRAATAMATSDNFAQVTITATTAVTQGVWCRGDNTLTTGYAVRNNGTSWDLFSVVSSAFTNIGTYSAAAVAGDTVKIQAVGSTIKAFINGVERISVTNTAVATGTTVGIRSQANSTLRYDNFSAADVAASYTVDAALSATATLAATGQRATDGASSLATTATLAASGQRATLGDGQCAATAALDAVGHRAAVTDAALAATAVLTAAGTHAAAAGGVLAATVVLTAAAAATGPVVPGSATAGVPAVATAGRGLAAAPTATGGQGSVRRAAGGG